MEISSLEFVEFYVADLDEATDRFTRQFMLPLLRYRNVGWSGHAQRSAELVCGSTKVILTSSDHHRHPARAFIEEHGEGVGNIGLGVADASRALAAAVAGGATPLRPAKRLVDGHPDRWATVQGIGDVAHTFVEAPPVGPAPGIVSGASAGPLTGIDHLAMCVPAGSLDRVATFYEQALGFVRAFELSIVVGDQGMDSVVVQDPAGHLVLTLVSQDPSRQPGQVEAFLHDHGGAGIQHVAFNAPSITVAVEALRGAAVPFLDVPAEYYDGLRLACDEAGPAEGGPAEVDVWERHGILQDRDDWGVILQAFTRSEHPRKTLFYELVERRNARTFGSGNVKALYQAVQRSGMDGHVAGASPARR